MSNLTIPVKIKVDFTLVVLGFTITLKKIKGIWTRPEDKM